MRINEILTEAGVPGALRKGLFKATGLGGSPAVTNAVAKDNFIKKFASNFDLVSQDQTGAFDAKDYLESVIDQNNWGPVTPIQQQALDKAISSNNSTNIASVIYQIGMQNRGGSSVAKKRAMSGTQANQVKSTTGQPDDLSTNTAGIMSKIEMMASSGNVDDLEAICRDALNVLNKVAPTHYAKFIKQLTTGKNPNSLAPAAVDKTGVVRGSTGKANIGVQDLPPEVQQRLAQQQK
jgi:hypothetical protein